MKEVLKMVPALVVVAGPPLLAGVRGRPLIGWVWAACLGLLAIITATNEPAHYDMRGFGFKLFGGAAAVAVLALLVGMALRRLGEARQRGRSARDQDASGRPE